ncbi:helix-turn-helix domain-containing protein [Pantoea sp. A4]|uniref:helix-turn-helix domain-containing protein n=1 Tax=Pantoea sp. A4 TaxID=1225184 RepID=UPI00037E07A1|nr:helix-turn-helix domain-containing protein [Pantoea sp. A4]
MLSLQVKQQYIHDLVDWIEANLTDDLNIESITAKSGYSRWHMQRMFKEITGQTLASYTRKRRLTIAAMALRLTRLSLIDIAVRFGFENQQNFTRVFKSHFMITPGVFRRIPELHFRGFHGRISTEHGSGVAQLITRDELHLCGEVAEWECAFGEFVPQQANIVAEHARRFVNFAGQHSSRGWLGFQYGPGQSGAEQQQISLYQALESHHQDKLTTHAVGWTAPAGLYATIHWQGTPEQINPFIAEMYYNHLPELGVARREGKDLLRLEMQQSSSEWLTGMFSIPVTRVD